MRALRFINMAILHGHSDEGGNRRKTWPRHTDLGQCGQGVDEMLVLENSAAQRRHHDAYRPACVALQLDDLVRAVVNVIHISQSQ